MAVFTYPWRIVFWKGGRSTLEWVRTISSHSSGSSCIAWTSALVGSKLKGSHPFTISATSSHGILACINLPLVLCPAAILSMCWWALINNDIWDLPIVSWGYPSRSLWWPALLNLKSGLTGSSHLTHSWCIWSDRVTRVWFFLLPARGGLMSSTRMLVADHAPRS